MVFFFFVSTAFLKKFSKIISINTALRSKLASWGLHYFIYLRHAYTVSTRIGTGSVQTVRPAGFTGFSPVQNFIFSFRKFRDPQTLFFYGSSQYDALRKIKYSFISWSTFKRAVYYPFLCQSRKNVLNRPVFLTVTRRSRKFFQLGGPARCLFYVPVPTLVSTEYMHQ